MKSVESAETTENLRVNLLTQEIKFAKMLAGNTFDGALKEKHIDKLSIWLKNRTACTEAFTDKDCLRIWKGLFYSMWMSDKPIPQENLANKISGLLHCFDRYEVSLQFFATFLRTMANEWNGIDQWRIDKFLMLVRKMTRELLRVIQNNKWSDDAIEKLNEMLKKTVLGSEFHVPRGLFMHFTELFFEEVAKVSNGNIESKTITKLLKPFMFYVASQSDYKLIQFVVRSVFNHLLFQSESGREYKEKFDAWKSLNFPGKSINELVLEELDESGEEKNSEEILEDEDEVKDGESSVLDPRAGRVDVIMPEIKFDPLEIVGQLEELKYKKFTSVRNRKCIDRIVTTYKKFADGVFPIGIQKLKIDRDELELPDIEEKAEELIEFENELYGKQRELKQMNKRKRKKIVNDPNLFDEFQAKSNKVAKIKNEANVWKEEDISEENSVSIPAKKRKLSSKKSESKKVKKNELKESNENISIELLKNEKKHKNSDWEKPLEDGEVEYFIPSKKQQMNGVPRVMKINESVIKHAITQKVNGTDENVQQTADTVTPKKMPSSKVKKFKLKNEATPTKSIIEKTPEPMKKSSAEKKVKSTSKLAQSQTSTPNIFVDKLTPSSAEKRVKIALKMNRSQEVTEYIRQLKQSPHPYDLAKKPSKGVLKPNLAPSPINPFYKRLIGIE